MSNRKMIWRTLHFIFPCVDKVVIDCTSRLEKKIELHLIIRAVPSSTEKNSGINMKRNR